LLGEALRHAPGLLAGFRRRALVEQAALRAPVGGGRRLELIAPERAPRAKLRKRIVHVPHQLVGPGGFPRACGHVQCLSAAL
jgi:hypothetical protein